MEFRDAIALLAIIVGAVSAGMAIATYRRNVQNQQTAWLHQLFEKFYEKPTYRKVRALLDNRSAEAPAQIARLAAGGEDAQTGLSEQDLVDYLNFFEFICDLEARKRLKRGDMDALFDYYLRNLAMLPDVAKYIEEEQHGFEALAREIRRRKGVI